MGALHNNIDETMDRSVVEKVYPVKIAHVTVSAIPVVTATAAVVANVTYVGNGPSFPISRRTGQHRMQR